MSDYSITTVAIIKESINAKTTGTTVLGTTENGTQRFVPTYIVLECTAASAISVGPTVSVGISAGVYEDILPPVAMSSTTANHIDVKFAGGTTSNANTVAANTDIRVNVQTAATGTSMTIRVALIGYYV